MKALRNIVRFSRLRNKSIDKASKLMKKGDTDSRQNAQYHRADANDYGAQKIPASKKNYMKGKK